MTPLEARELILHHAFSHPDSAEHPKSATGFLGSLRPYRGTLDPANFHEVMASLTVLAPSLETQSVDRETVGALWAITHLARMWGVDPGGMLRSNNLISDDDVATLQNWVDMISYATLMLLSGAGRDEAFHDYRNREA